MTTATETDSHQLKIGNKTFNSRLIVGTGKYPSFEMNKQALEISGAEMITVAVRRIELDKTKESILNYIDPKKYTLLPNTAGCFNVKEAVMTCQLAREAGLGDFVKVEVIGDPKTLFPDNEATLEACKLLVKDGFTVLPYCMDDVVLCKKLEDAGCAAVMPLAAPIGSGLGIRNPYNVKLILEAVKVPVIIDAGVGTASDAARAMELGVAGLLMNTAIAQAKDPLKMAKAMRLGVECGRLAFEAGRIPKKLYATASSPLDGLIDV
ncbi:thiazole synthase [Nitrospina watsonii]|uniref:Thiazole synthase n=1 Tax=Nitrospina watsonii TaxID=1323948 RepID=A0ABM9HHU0_9BACT|nr:thiazole synthase [Nitrospina watsonii]CAI2719621.1 1-deoxy-D-xylulose 5-phosphate:thiol sulfurtransferase [Nitrospina watsonii]